ncbi:prepilin-type N-terminal cleavage/methylation domain-containing protein [Candidatus Woesebacteria bacterium]|nr:prepilin-type N-terminal cleavage/methylation domain-containing protein [Candidatus Woesebacteria bacterium]
MKNHSSGFTLIEIVITLVLLLSILSLLSVSIVNQTRDARDNRRKTDLEEIRSALELYRMDQPNRAYPVSGDLAPFLVPTYLRTLPTDPASNTNYDYSALPDSPLCDNTPGNLCSSYTLTTTLDDGSAYVVGPGFITPGI